MSPSLLLLLAIGLGPPNPDAARTHTVTAEDYFTLAQVTDVAPSPDGAHVVWVESRWEDQYEYRNADLWIVDAKGRRPRRLTFHPGYDKGPQWSRDGAWIYFVSGRKLSGKKAPLDGKKQVWRVRPDGRDLMPVTRVKGGVERFALAPDDRSVYFTTKVEHYDDDDYKALRKKHDVTYGRGVRQLSDLRQLDLATWRTETLIEAPERFIREFALDPAGTRVAMITVPTRRLIDNEGWSRVEVMDLATKEKVVLRDDAYRGQAPSPYGWLSSLAWADDGKKLAFRVDFDGYPGELLVAHVWGLEDKGTMRLPRQDEATLSGHVAWRPRSDEVCVQAILRAVDFVYCVADVELGRHGTVRRRTSRPSGVVHDFAFTQTGRLAAVIADLTHPPDVFWVSPSGGTTYDRLTRVNPQVDTWRLPTIRRTTWTGEDGTEVEGVLELPPDHDGEALPLLVEIHGGPTSAARFEMRFWIYGRTLYGANGWAVLSPNYRGSTGYGDAFLTDLIGRKNDVDVTDILTGVDALVKRGVADPKRMALMGWSNGGYLTNCIIARTDRFAAASSGAGVVETTMQWMIEDTPGHVVNFSQGLPWNAEAREAMWRTSPLYALDKVETPTLIHVGARDERVPPQHARALFRALDQYLGVPTELVEYPREPHGLGKKKHRAAKLAWDQAWLDRYVLGTSDDGGK